MIAVDFSLRFSVKKKLSEKVFSFFSLPLSDFVCFPRVQTLVRCAPAETCESQHWLHPADTRCCCRCRCRSHIVARKAPPLSLQTLWRVQVLLPRLLGPCSSAETGTRVGKQRWETEQTVDYELQLVIITWHRTTFIYYVWFNGLVHGPAELMS